MSVRITQGTTNRGYLKNLNNSQHAMNQAMEKIETGRAFTRVSQNVTGGTGSIDLRARIYRNEQMQDNVNTASEQLSVAEDCVTEMSDMCTNVNSEMLKALSTTNLESAKETYISYLQGAKDEFLRLANSKYNNKYVMGGLGVDNVPFKPDDDGMLMFNDVHVADMTSKDKKGYHTDAGLVPYSADAYMDIGLDISVEGGTVSPKTAYKVSVDGINILGYGKTEVSYKDINGLDDEEEISNNLYDMMTEMQNAIRDSDTDKLSAILTNFKSQTENLVTGLSEIGVRTKYLENTLDRLETENTSLLKMQHDVEGVDDATEITNFYNYQNSWNLVLQFGRNIVPKSLMDYVN